MAVFVHICAEADVKRIRRTELKVQKGRHGIYAMPVTPDFYASHQWLRELRRWCPGPAVAIYLRIPGKAPVLYGHYGGPHALGTADMAVAALLADPDHAPGFECILGGDIAPGAIIRATPMKPITGWRYYPKAKGREPCGCPACQPRGEPFSRRFRERYEAENG